MQPDSLGHMETGDQYFVALSKTQHVAVAMIDTRITTILALAMFELRTQKTTWKGRLFVFA